mgnify:CR=1 FL=1
MTYIPSFTSDDIENGSYNHHRCLFTHKAQNYVAMMSVVKDQLFPGYNWDQLTGDTKEVIRQITNDVLTSVERDLLNP